MTDLFQQLLFWLFVSGSLGGLAGWLLAKIYAKHETLQLQQSTRQQIEKVKHKLHQCQQQAIKPDRQPVAVAVVDVDCQEYKEKIAQLEKSLLDVLKSRH